MPISLDEKSDVEISWITKEFLEDVLRGEDESSDVSVTGSDIELAVAKGDNYLSTLYRVRVHLEQDERDRDLIIKVLPAGEYMQKVVHEIGFFRRELEVYHTVLPALYRLQENSGLASLTAQCFHTSRPDTLILEDLRPKGFVMSERRNRLDLPHCRLVVRSLARLHGLSVVLLHREPAMLVDVVDTMYSEGNRKNLTRFLEPQIKTLADVVETWSGFEKFGSLIRDLIPNAICRLINVVKPIKGDFQVFNHGDSWINNILFHYSSSGEVEDLKFVDFQLSRVSSPALDLQYFLCTSPQDKVRDQCWDQLLGDYHETLCAVVRELDADIQIPSLQELMDEMRRVTFFGFMASVTTLAAVVGDPDDSPELAEYKEEEQSVNVFEKIQKSVGFKQPFQKLLLAFEKAGMFE